MQGENEGVEGSFESQISVKEKENEEHRNENWNEEQFGLWRILVRDSNLLNVSASS